MIRILPMMMVLALGSAIAQRAIERSVWDHPPLLPARVQPSSLEPSVALPLDQSRSDRTQAVSFTRLFRAGFTNLTYFFPSQLPMVYEPISRTLGVVEHIYQDNRATGGNLGTQLVFRYSTNRGTTWLRQTLVNNPSTFFGVPQIALANPSSSSSVTDLKVCMTGYRYPSETGYRRTGTAVFVRTEGQIFEYSEQGPVTNNSQNYAFGAGRLVGFNGGADRSGFAYCGILSPPTETVPYGQYGSLVINARLADLEDFVGTIPSSWDNSQFRTAPQPTSTYNSPMYVDADGNSTLYAVINALFADDQDNRVLAVSKSTDMGQSWSTFDRMPTSVLQAYASNRGAAIAVPYRVYDQSTLVVTGENRFSYIGRIGLFADQNTFVGLDLVETEYNNGNWTMRLIAPINDIPVVYSYNDSASQARNYQQLVCDEVISSLGNEVEVARTADGSDIIVKWIDHVPSATPIVLNPPQVALRYDQQTGDLIGETQVDTLPVFNIFIAYRSLSSETWSDPINLTGDSYFNKGTHIPLVVPSRTQIPLLTIRSLASTDWNQQSDAGRLLAQSPQDYVNRIYDIPHDVSFAMVSATVSAEATPRINQATLVASPVPASDALEVAWSGLLRGGELVIVNMLGQTVLSKTVAASDGVQGAMLDVRMLPVGTYSLQLRTSQGVVATTPVVVVR